MAPEVVKRPFKEKPDENKGNTSLHYTNNVHVVRGGWLGRM